MSISVENVNKTFPRYPMTVADKNWIYGVWYCGTSWSKVRLHGQYPPTFLKRALSLFPDAKVLHVPSGTVEQGITVDRVVCDVRRPMIQADASALPFLDNTFDVVLSDPPYTPEDSKKYGCKPFPMVAMMRESARVLKPGGYLGVLHTYYPSYRRRDWDLIGLIAVVTGFMRATRMFSIFKTRKTVGEASPDLSLGITNAENPCQASFTKF